MGLAIKRLREGKNLSQSELANAVTKHNGIAGTQYISDIENGRRSPAGDELLSALATALDVERDYLYLKAGLLCPSLRRVEIAEKGIGEAIDAFKRAAERTLFQMQPPDASVKYNLRYSRTALDAIYTGELPVAFGTYLNSLVKRNRPYRPKWQTALRDRVCDELTRFARVVRPTAKVIAIEGAASNDGRVVDGLNLEFMIQTVARDRDIKIDEIGFVYNLALVYVKESSVGAVIAADEFPTSTWLDALAKVPIGVLAGHAPDDLLKAAVMVKKVGAHGKDPCGTVGKLFAWLQEHGDDGVVACDWGVAKPLVDDAAKLGIDLAIRRVPYPQRLRVGFAVPRDDEHWLEFIKEMRIDVTRQPEHQAEWQETIKRMDALQIKLSFNAETF